MGNITTRIEKIKSLRIAVYIRYSSENQRDGYSIEYQLDECKKYIEEQGYTLVEVYIDEAATGKNTNKRDSFFRLLSDVKNGLYDAVVVYKYSRFARNLMEARLYHHQIEKSGAKLISAMERIDDSTPEGRMMRNIIMSMDEYYSDNLSTFVQSAMYTVAKKAKYMGGILPFGFSADDEGNFIENKQEADIVRRAFALKAEGATNADILNIFLNEGITSRSGKIFTQQLLNKIFRAEKYIGTYKYEVKGYEPIIIKNAFEPIVDKYIWDKVQHMININAGKRNVSQRKRKFSYPLTGKIYCGCCGEPFTGNSKVYANTRLFYYTCRGQDKLQICKNGSLNKEVLEEYVFNNIKKHILSENLIDNITQIVFNNMQNNSLDNNIIDDIKKLKKEKSDIEKKLEKMLDLALDGVLDRDILLKKSNELQSELQLIEKTLKSKEFTVNNIVTYGDIRAFILDMISKLDNADDIVKKAIASQFIDQIIVHKDSVTVKLTVTPFFSADKINKGWALFTLTAKRIRNKSGFTLLDI